ncbi:uncharacterized protein F4812DRAFT_291718 [Daldinia caldariorum]|uniref:uncharacterized protein n=1 Tax=Daldinia caldariorum TaxID=326644 RepID=UPI0020077B1C|nr:uncharacterized protein F4812DRAFT_291718 [Daldinia caldariorum]KAI1462974.1 hypothetical protein F4812DRAFT_291718 [Daldinia caldariorum]
MQVLPFIQVKDLAPSASFYAAVVQPLGLRYISATPTSVLFGDTASSSPEPVFELKQDVDSDSQFVRPCRIVLSARSPSAVAAFHEAALRSNPDLKDGKYGVNYIRIQKPDSSEESRAIIGDFDGNIMEVIHANTSKKYAASRTGSTVSRSHSSSQESSRVLDWTMDVGAPMVPLPRSIARPAAPGSTVGSYVSCGDSYTVVPESTTTSSTIEPPPEEGPKGLNATTILGAVFGLAVGAAVGGALTYNSLKNKEEQETMAFQGHNIPPFTRRSTYPDQSPDRPRYYPPSSYNGGNPRGRMVEDVDDRSSRYSSHYTTGSRSRGRSEASSSRRPFMIDEHEYKSSSGSKYRDSSRPPMESEYRSNTGRSRHSHAPESRSHASSRHSPDSESDWCTYVSSKHTTASSRPRDAEAETYVSAKTDKSAGTARGTRTSPSRAPFKAASRYPSSTHKGSNDRRASRRLESHAGSGFAVWDDDDDDAGSVAPSDSISNIGSRHGRRSQHV